jgi:hypothetical protein
MKIFPKYRTIAALFLLLPILLFLNSCDSKSTTTITDSSTDTDNYNVTLTGTILSASSSSILADVTVRVLYGSYEKSCTTDSYGKFSTQFNVDTGMVVTVIASLTNYVTDTIKVYVAKNSVNNVTAISLVAVTTSKASGYAASIYQYSQSTTSIGVRGGGAIETGSIVFQVVDSLGVSLDAAHSALVKFGFGGHPNGGEFLTPQYVFTDSLGQAKVFLTSGTISGVVQVIAEITQSNLTITSLPVSYTINGGLPETSHFSIASQYLNFAGYDIFGLTNSITAYVGDKYSNPVRLGTSVYFSSTGGLIPATAQTSQSGTASVSLLSAAPRPTDATYGAGFATITASTIDETKQQISKSQLILFSGIPLVTVSPTTFNIANGGSQTFNYYVKDENNNPLAPNSSITVTVTGDNVKTAGETEFVLPDTQSKAYTHFSFQIYDSQDTVETTSNISVKIKVTGTNGTAQTTITGTSK